MNNNDYKRGEFEKRRNYKGTISMCKGYTCPVFLNCLLEIKKLQQENKKLNGAIQTYNILLKANAEENKQLKEDIKNIIKIVDKNCDDLEATEEEFDSLDRWQGLQVVELEQGSDN